MLPNNEDKKMLIQSMKKLTNHICNNTQRQKQIFDSLTRKDIMKVVSNLWDQNQYLRRVSGLLLCQLLYNNKESKDKMVNILQMFPSNGRICLNKIPDTIQRYPSTLKRCVQLMKIPISRQQQSKMCWVINLDRKVLQLQFLQYKKYSSFTFLDPARNLFGVTVFSQQYIEKVQKQKPNLTVEQKVNAQVQLDNYMPTERRPSKGSYQINSSRFSTDSQQKVISKYFRPTASKKTSQQDSRSYVNNTMYNVASSYSGQSRQIKQSKFQYISAKKQQISPSTRFELYNIRKNQTERKKTAHQKKIGTNPINLDGKLQYNIEFQRQPKQQINNNGVKPSEFKNVIVNEPIIYSQRSQASDQAYKRIRQILRQ